MDNFLIIVGVVLILSFLVFIHELGHFLAARRNGIRVLEFGIGFPPKVWTIKKGDTVYSFNLIPFGGFVKLYGEDSSDKRVLKSPHSYASKTPWQKMKVVLAGVLMNFLVFWVLMSISLMIGIAPMITSQDEYRAAFMDGTFKGEPGVIVDEFYLNGELAPSLTGREVTAIDGEEVNFESAREFASREVESAVLTIDGTDYDVLSDDVKLHPLSVLPVVTINRVAPGSIFVGEFQKGDTIVTVNDIPVFDLEAFVAGFYAPGVDEVKVDYLRDGESLSAMLPAENRYVISSFSEGSTAKEGGLEVGDKVISVNGSEVFVGQNPSDFVEGDGIATYRIERRGAQFDYGLEPVDGLVGIVLFPEVRLSDLSIDFYQDTVLGSVTEIDLMKEPFYKAPFVALSQGWKISILTADAFVRTIGDVAVKLEVSDEIGGPVQVARLSYFFVQEGGVDLLNFIALISLSLAVINIIPIPALDGGRLVFIIIEAFRGKPLNPRIEAMIHTFGFLFLMLLIAVVTLNDIVNI